MSSLLIMNSFIFVEIKAIADYYGPKWIRSGHWQEIPERRLDMVSNTQKHMG